MPHSVLFTIPNFITAGSGRCVLNLVERLDRKRFSPSVCVLRRGGALERELERLGVPLMEAPFVVDPRPYNTFVWRAWRCAQVFRPYKLDLWHSFHYLDDFTEPIIARLAGAQGWIYTKKNMNWHRRSWYLRSLLASRIPAQNTDMLRDFFGSWPFKQTARLVPPGVDTSRFSANGSGTESLRQTHGVPRGDLTLGCVADLVPVKGHPTLLKALARTPGVHLFLAGKPLDKSYAEELERLVKQFDIEERVHFLGHLNDVPAFLSQVDIFVLPTWARWRMEGCPVALLEAMASGKPCIATNIPGPRDVIEDGVNGLIVPPEDEHLLARAITDLMSSEEKRATLSQNARARILSNYTIEREVAQHEQLYGEVLR